MLLSQALDSRLEMFVDGRLNSTVAEICREFFGFVAKNRFFLGKKSDTLLFSVDYVG